MKMIKKSDLRGYQKSQGGVQRAYQIRDLVHLLATVDGMGRREGVKNYFEFKSMALLFSQITFIRCCMVVEGKTTFER